MNEVKLGKQVFSRAYTIPEKTLQGMSNVAIQSYYDDLLSALIVKVKRDVLAQKLEPRNITSTKNVYSYVPATWWDHFKYQYRNKWWMPRRFKKWNHRKIVMPATFRVKVEPMYLFPDANVVLPNMGTSVKFVDISGE